MTTKSWDILDTSWAAIDSAESVLTKSRITEYGNDGELDTSEQEQIFTKAEFERDLRKVSRKVKK